MYTYETTLCCERKEIADEIENIFYDGLTTIGPTLSTMYILMLTNYKYVTLMSLLLCSTNSCK